MPVAEPFKLEQIFSKLSGLSKIALAVSGGSDSMAMLRMVRDWAKHQDHQVEIIALTVDHGLRSAAAAEAQQVSNWCAALGIQHQTLRWLHQGVSTGIQAKARIARYDLMTAWCGEHKVSALLTAHTADDQAETVMMRRARTNSLRSIAGIWPEREWQGIQVLRPLLNLRRTELQAYLKAVGQEWIDDPSNADTRFERVRVRGVLDGELHSLAADAQEAQHSIESAQQASSQWCASHIQIHETGFLTVQREALASLDELGFDFAIQRMIELCGRSTRNVEREERLKLQAWLHENKVARRTLGGALFAKRKDTLIVAREPGRISKTPGIIGPGGTLIWDDRFQIMGPAGAQVVPLRDVSPLARREDIAAFVQSGLPAIVVNGQIWSIPHLAMGQPVEIKFLRY